MKTLLVVLALAVMMSSVSYSQGTGLSSPNTATFNVDVAIAVTPLAGDFGQLLAGTTYTVTADGYISPADALGSTTVVPIEWDITGAIDANVLISFGLPAFFTSATGGAHVPYSVSAQSAGWSDTPISAGASYNPIDPRLSSTITLIGGAATVQLGGVLAVPTTATGTYSAQFVLVASNTGL